MATEVRLRRGTTAQHASFTGAPAEVTVDTDRQTLVVHDGLTPGGHPIGVGLPFGHIDKLTLSNSSTDAANDIVVSPGECVSDSDEPVFIVLPSAITKRLDAAWAAGTGNGGLDTGSKASSAWYHVWVIKNLTSGAVDVLFSLSATNPNMPSGWTEKRRIGAIGTDGSGVIRPFWQTGSYFGLATPHVALSGIPLANNGAVLRSLDVPLGVKLRLNIFTAFSSVANRSFFGVKDADEGIATLADADGVMPSANLSGGVSKALFCSASGQVYTYGQHSDTTLNSFYVKGWFDMRGREDDDI